MISYIENLARIVAATHHCSCRHIGAEYVRDVTEEMIWHVRVELFQLAGHSNASLAYGWGWMDGSDEMLYVAIANVPPVRSAADAVRQSLANA